MAALKNHGTEIARITYTWALEDAGTDYRTLLSFRSDGHILRRDVALNIHGPGDHHNYGWKLYKRMAAKGMAGSGMADKAQRVADRAAALGTLVSVSGSIALPELS